MYVKKGDKVKVIIGKDKGKFGKVFVVFLKKDCVFIEGINMVKKYIKFFNINL